MKKILITLMVLTTTLLVASHLPYSFASAQDAGDAVCDTLGQAAGGSCASTDESSSSISKVVVGGLNLLTFAAGVATVVMVIIAGVKYLTSQGDAAAVANAKGTLMYALVGIVVVVLSQTIIYFFIDSATPKAPTPANCTQGICRS